MRTAVNALVTDTYRTLRRRSTSGAHAVRLRLAGAAPSAESTVPELKLVTGTDAGLGFKAAGRVQTSLLASVERRCLNWLARRTPGWVSPDHLTLLGLTAMLFAGATYALARWWAPALLVVNVWLALNWLGDSLDGTLARFRNKQRPRYGFYVDHICDAFGALFLLGGLALSGYITVTVALALLVAFSLLSINVYLATYTIGTFRLSFYKFSPTELRAAIAIGNVAVMFRPLVHVFGQKRLLFDVAAVIASFLMVVVLVISVIRNVVTLYRSERV
jgi:phosphatidylglycerophosphate synthase